MSSDPIELLRQLVAIPSLNPMGRPDPGPGYGEARLTEYLESLFRRAGVAFLRQEVEPGRENILARVEGELPPEQGGQILMLSAHQDTVPAEGMTVEPFRPAVRDGRLYGRGACDVKGGLAAMLAVFLRLAAQRPPGMPTLVLACTANEECGFTGARALAASLSGGCSGFVPRRPDAAVVAEPTELDVVVAHKGVVRWRCHTRGLAVHSACPEAGQNAIYRMARAVRRIEQYQAVLASQPPHPLCGRPTVNVGTIHGGVGVNVVPDHCAIEIDRRLSPDETPEQAYRDCIQYLADQPDLDFPLEHDRPFMEGLALCDGANRILAEQIAELVRRLTGHCRVIGVPFATDAAFLAAAGIPTVVFGPGSLAQAHTADEWISLEQLRQATEVFYELARSGVQTAWRGR